MLIKTLYLQYLCGDLHLHDRLFLCGRMARLLFPDIDFQDGDCFCLKVYDEAEPNSVGVKVKVDEEGCVYYFDFEDNGWSDNVYATLAGLIYTTVKQGTEKTFWLTLT